MDREPRQATVHVVTKSWTQLSDYHFHFQSSKQQIWTTGNQEREGETREKQSRNSSAAPGQGPGSAGEKHTADLADIKVVLNLKGAFGTAGNLPWVHVFNHSSRTELWKLKRTSWKAYGEQFRKA